MAKFPLPFLLSLAIGDVPRMGKNTSHNDTNPRLSTSAFHGAATLSRTETSQRRKRRATRTSRPRWSVETKQPGNVMVTIKFMKNTSMFNTGKEAELHERN
ncbi:hypothetical protein [Chryseolinea lacunae]|uniref:Secreted protein n=1 Tax=Chryseolinea lacunae TaxID=2801331 RepID=A0ABS1KQY7_9BACT|nr:hypothetical protein [Chryseolinea lacunae]MBL0741864.1 hypothetical protein [Chryseolinea lacunae]